MAHSKRKNSNRETVNPSVLEYAKNLNPEHLPYSWIFYNEKENDDVHYSEKVFYISEEYNYPTIVDLENYELVKTKSGEGIWVILPLSATRYVFYRQTDIPIEEYYSAKNILLEWNNSIRNNSYFITQFGNI